MPLKHASGQPSIPVNVATAFRPFIAAVANRASTPANVLCIGDSITEGQAATTAANRWIELLRDGVRSNFPVAGVAGGVGFVPPYRDATSLPQPSTLSAALTKGGNGQGLGSRISVLVNVGDTQKFTVSGTSVDVVYAKIAAGGGAFTVAYSSDGGTTYSAESAAVSCDGAGSFTDMLFARVTFPRRGSYIVRITCSTANAQIGGLMVYDGDEGTVGSEATTGKGIRLWEAGHFGTTAAQQAGYIYMTRWARQTAPSLVTIELGANDYAANGDPAAFQANLQTIIANVRTGCTQAGVPSPTIVLVAVPQRTGTFTYSWTSYVAAMKGIAAIDDHVTVLDLSAVISSVADNSLLLFADAVHPDNRGHAVFAAYVTGFLIPAALLGTSQLHGNEMHQTPMIPVGSMPFTRFKPGAYYGPFGGTVVTSYQPASGDLRLAPFIVGSDAAVPFDRLSVNVTGAGTAGTAKTRLVIYRDSGQGYPGALLFDSGQLAADVVAEVFAALAPLSLAPGLYWIGAVTQGAPATLPAYYGISGAVGLPIPQQNVAAATGAPNGVNTTAVTAAPPDPFPTALAAVGSVVKAHLRAA